MQVVLIHPEIPWNTGNIGRTCVATSTPLHLVQPLGFDVDHKWVKRAGLDYWEKLDLTIHESLRAFLRSDVANDPLFLFSRFAKRSLYGTRIPKNAVLVFGSETQGLSKSFKKRFSRRLFRIPTPGPVRSLNLSTAVAIALFEGMRQNSK